MPLYEYRCEACGAEEEALESFSAPVEHACAPCGAPLGMRRQLSRAGFVLSGGGWYATGYGQEAKKDAVKSDVTKTAAKADATAGSAPGDSTAAAAPASSGGCAGGCSCH
ncbi:MAG TPA: zinc ribbon domain-containing protein [Holophagaceae bacterium]|jgi:putative FmdB family regulatory protein|nr:zinc ribbon domain-containing protein [Holophagaceae bacterium]